MSAVRQTAVRQTMPRNAAARPEVRPARPAPRPRLSVVRAPAQPRTRVPFVGVCMALLAAPLLSALLLNTAMAQGEYERAALQSRLARSTQSQQQLAQELEVAGASAQLATAASALGMVPTSYGAYLRLSDGVVLGDPVPAGVGG